MIDTGILLLVWLILNVYGYHLMKVDKQKAHHRQWRIPERRMFVTAFLGGAIGIYIGMRRFHHKTKHLTFLIFIPVCIVWNCFCIFGMLRYVFMW